MAHLHVEMLLACSTKTAFKLVVQTPWANAKHESNQVSILICKLLPNLIVSVVNPPQWDYNFVTHDTVVLPIGIKSNQKNVTTCE